MVIDLPRDGYDIDAVKKMKERLSSVISERGWKTVDAKSVFKAKCYYDASDERVIRGLQNGSLYRVISLFSFSTPCFREEYHWVRLNGWKDEETEVKDGEMPVDVRNLLDRLESEKRSFDATRATKGAQSLATAESYSSEPLLDFEVQLTISFMLLGNRDLCRSVGISEDTVYSADDIHKFVKGHPDVWESVMHGWICSRMRDSNACLRLGGDYLPMLAELHGCKGYKEAMMKIDRKQRSSYNGISEQLKKLGYDISGEKLQ